MRMRGSSSVSIQLSRRTLFLLGMVVAVVVVWRMLVPPVWTVKRLDAPDGSVEAVLERTPYVGKHHFRVRLREDGGWWRTVYVSPPVPGDFRIDHHEQLQWSGDGRELVFEMEGTVLWRYEREPES